jgi:hypothetical protein
MEPNSHYRSSSVGLVLSNMNIARITPPQFFNIHSNIIYPSTPRSSKRSLPIKYSDQNLYEFLIFSEHATCHAYLTLLDLIMIGEGYIMWSFSLCRFLQPPFIPSLLIQIFCSVFCSQTLPLCIHHYYKSPNTVCIQNSRYSYIFLRCNL